MKVDMSLNKETYYNPFNTECSPLHFGVVAIKKRVFRSPLTTVANLTILLIILTQHLFPKFHLKNIEKFFIGCLFE